MNYQVMPSLTPAEFEGLKADIARHGVLVPVEMDETGNILDGHHRVQAWQELRDEGVTLPDYPRMVRSGMTEEAKRNHARRLNVMRRQLSREQRDEVMRAMRADGMSQRQIAQAVGVSLGTVSNALTCSGDQNWSPEQVIGADGKSYPAERNLVEQRNEIIRAMRADGMSQRQIAQAVGVSLGTVSNVLALVGDENSSPTNLIEGADGKFRPSAYAPRAEPPPSLFVPGGAVTLDPVAAQTQVKQERQEIRDARRVERVDKINAISRGNAPLATVTSYPVIYADPPWRYEHSRTDNRQIENHYPTMDLTQICALPVGEVAAPDAVLFLWATSPKLAESMQVIDAWGFTYRTCMVWDKEVIGMGYYARQQHELLLIATRGNLPTPEPANRPPSVVRVRRPTEHSEKPTEFYALIESMYPEYARIELFARNARQGWAVWGNQAND
jgi:N6-adenosine-specific RNA methylase IME4/ParB-like chromosome segregation protein Spo0J